MRILDRYVAGQFVRLFVLFALSAPVLFVLGDLTDQLDNYFKEGLTARQIAIGYVYDMPEFILYSFPVAALIATIFTINGMTRNSEVAAAKAGGVSFHRLLVPVFLLGVVLTGGALGLSELMPIAKRAKAELQGDEDRRRSTRSDFVYRAQDGYVYTVQRLNRAQARLTGVSVERPGDEVTTPSLHIVAAEAVYEPETSTWTLHDGYARLLIGRGTESSFRFDELITPGFDASPEKLLAVPREPEEMRYAELGEFIEAIQRSGGRAAKLRVEHAQKIALPVATLIIILFAAPLANQAPRGGAAYGVGISLAVTILYLMLFKVAGAAGESGVMSPMIAAWLPNGIFALAAVGLLARVRT
ncbi:MAG TPA: LptF/LptG family permease [Longimicrobiales bacterium]